MTRVWIRIRWWPASIVCRDRQSQHIVGRGLWIEIIRVFGVYFVMLIKLSGKVFRWCGNHERQTQFICLPPIHFVTVEGGPLCATHCCYCYRGQWGFSCINLMYTQNSQQVHWSGNKLKDIRAAHACIWMRLTCMCTSFLAAKTSEPYLYTEWLRQSN